MKTITTKQLNRKVKRLILLFIIGLCLSGITAFPLLQEIGYLHDKISPHTPEFVQAWMSKVYNGIKNVNGNYSFMAYGTDWLAFAHLVIAVAFVGPYIDPVKNIWVIQFGRIACIMIFPLAFICGGMRGIPVWWQLIDCSFGVVGYFLLSLIYWDAYRLESNSQTTNY